LKTYLHIDHPECCGEPMDCDGRLVVCFTCGNRHESELPRLRQLAQVPTYTPKGFFACFASYGRFANVVAPTSDPLFKDGIPFECRWFLTKGEACEFLQDHLTDLPSNRYERIALMPCR
jgi:hypothetical protein